MQPSRFADHPSIAKYYHDDADGRLVWTMTSETDNAGMFDPAIPLRGGHSPSADEPDEPVIITTEADRTCRSCGCADHTNSGTQRLYHVIRCLCLRYFISEFDANRPRPRSRIHAEPHSWKNPQPTARPPIIFGLTSAKVHVVVLVRDCAGCGAILFPNGTRVGVFNYNSNIFFETALLVFALSLRRAKCVAVHHIAETLGDVYDKAGQPDARRHIRSSTTQSALLHAMIDHQEMSCPTTHVDFACVCPSAGDAAGAADAAQNGPTPPPRMRVVLDGTKGAPVKFGTFQTPVRDYTRRVGFIEKPTDRTYLGEDQANKNRKDINQLCTRGLSAKKWRFLVRRLGRHALERVKLLGLLIKDDIERVDRATLSAAAAAAGSHGRSSLAGDDNDDDDDDDDDDDADDDDDDDDDGTDSDRDEGGAANRKRPSRSFKNLLGAIASKFSPASFVRSVAMRALLDAASLDWCTDSPARQACLQRLTEGAPFVSAFVYERSLDGPIDVNFSRSFGQLCGHIHAIVVHTQSICNAHAAVDVAGSGAAGAAAGGAVAAAAVPLHDHAREFFTTGNCYPAAERPEPARVQGVYNADARGREIYKAAKCPCTKHSADHKKSRILMVLTCLGCKRVLGFSLLPAAESPRTVFELFFTRFRYAPDVICYDNSCGACHFCLLREPLFFGNTQFVIDRWHYKSHKTNACSVAFDANRIAHMRGVNTMQSEQGNAELNYDSLANQLKYCAPATYFKLLLDFFAQSNRARTRADQL